MAIYNLDDLRAAVPADMQSMSDDSLVRDYAKRLGTSYEETADYLGVKPSGTLREMGRQAVGGLVVDLPRMGGQALKATGLDPVFGQELVNEADARAFQYEPDRREQGLTRQIFTSGARGLAPMLPAIGAAFLPGGQALAPAVAAGLFGSSAYQDTYEKLIDQGIDQDEAKAAALRTGVIKGPLEGVATAVGLRALKPLATALRGAKTTEQVATGLTRTGALKDAAKAYGVNLAVQPGTEVLQDVGAELVERAYGAAPEDILGIAQQSAAGGLGLTLLLGPFAAVSATRRASQAQKLGDDLQSEDADVRKQAYDFVTKVAKAQGVDEANVGEWYNARMVEERDLRIKAFGAQVEELDLTGPFGSLEQQREFEAGMQGVDLQQPFGSLGQQRAVEEGVQGLRDERIAGVGQQYQDLLAQEASSAMAAEDAGVEWRKLQAQRDDTLASAQAIGAQFQEQQTERSAAIQRVGAQAQDVMAEKPAPTTAPLTPMQRAALGGARRGRPTTEPLSQAQQAGSDDGRVSRVPITEAIASSISTRPAPSSPLPVAQAPAAQPNVSEGGSAATLTPAAQPAAGAFSELPAQTPAELPAQAQPAATQTLDDELAAAADDEVAGDIETILAAQDKKTASARNPLASTVEGAQAVTAPGRRSLTDAQVARITNAATNPEQRSRRLPKKERAILTELVNFGRLYKEYLDAAGNMQRPQQVINRGTTADQAVAPRVQNAVDLGNQTRAALSKLGEAVEGNSKDVDVLIATIKAASQGRINSITDPETLRAYKRLDSMISQAWTAAKSEAFIERFDMLNVRQEKVRAATEAKDQTPPLVRAAEGRANPRDKGPVYKGFLGVLHYIRFFGTGYERLLARQVREALQGAKNAPKLEFITTGESRYDPVNNTVYLHQTASNAVVLHEGLHAALQWFVYQNPKNPSVAQLRKSLKGVVEYKGELNDKAKEVQSLLKKLVKDGNENDAMLELVSYGNTLNEFRKALQAMPAKSTPRSFYEAAQDVWQAAQAIVRRLLGNQKTQASAVFQSTWDLLAEIGEAGITAPPVREGNVLEARVQSVPPTPRTEGSEAPFAQVVQDQTPVQAAIAANYPDLRAWRASPGSSFNLTRMLFERLGFGVTGKSTKAIYDASVKASAIVRENFPKLEGVILNLNSRFGLPPGMASVMEYFKTHQNTGILEMERLSEAMHQNPALAKPILDYLDGDIAALSGQKNSSALRAIADNVQRHLRGYIDALPEGSKERSLFEGLKFSEYLLNPQSFAQVATKSFGQGRLMELLGITRRNEDSIDEFRDLLPMQNDVVDSEAALYQVMETVVDNDGVKKRVPWGFISKETAETAPPAGLDIEKSRVWKFNGMVGKRFAFVSRTTSPEDVRRLADEGKVRELSAALLNTMAALSHNYASRNYFRGINELGRDADGKATAQTVVFDDIAEINSVFKGRELTSDGVLEASSDEAKSMAIRSKAQRTGVWVQLPSGPTYGPLAGKLVSGPVWSSMLDMHDRKPLISSQAFNQTMTWFKKAKTVYSPATHANNVLTNYSLMLLHGISHKTLRDAASMFARFEVSPDKMSKQQRDIIQAFYRSGAVLGQYTQTEAKQVIAEAMLSTISPAPGGSMLSRLGEFAGFEKKFAGAIESASRKAENFDSRAMELYAAGDNIFRLASFMSTAGNIQQRDGSSALSEQQLLEAGIAARKQFLDYDIDARWVRAARQSFLPFVSWSYAITPVLGRLAVEKPWTLVNMMAAVGLMSAVFDGDDDEWRLTGPDQIREKALWGVGPHMFMRVPFMGSDEDPVFWNIGKSIPMMALFDPPPGENKLLGQSWFPGALTPGGPYASLIASLFYGIDPFTGKKFGDETDDNSSRLVSAAKSVYNTMTPSLLQTRLFDSASKLADGTVGPTGKEPNALFMARFFGLSLYEFNRQETEFFNDKEVKRIKRDFSMAMSTAKREEYNKGYPDYESLDIELAALRERMDARIAELRGEK